MKLKQELFGSIPKVDRILNLPAIRNLIEKYPRQLVVEYLREELDQIRHSINNASPEQLRDLKSSGFSYFQEQIVQNLTLKLYPNLRRCVNATGIVLHTGLGRAPLSRAVKQTVDQIFTGFSSIELELNTGQRGNRHRLVENYLTKLTGAEAAAVVNNNAAATLLILNSIADGMECIVSRGELITIGGSFRIPDIMEKSGVKMVEIGTTNQTWVQDYEQAITEETGLLMKVHTSNYRISGFVQGVELDELVALGRKYDIPVVHDLGSGSLLDLSEYGLPKEPVVQESVATGVDVISFSGDKLLGGPQAGIIVGKKDVIDRIKKNQLARALRCDKITFAVLEATLRLFFDKANLVQEHSTLKLLTTPLTEIKKKARRLQKKVKTIVDDRADVGVIEGVSEIGGGSLATEALPTYLVFLKSDSMAEAVLAQKFRLNEIPIISRIQNGMVLFDMRTVLDEDFEYIVRAFKNIFNRE